METFRKLPRELQAILGGTAAYIVFSFFDWQQVSAFGITAGNSEWVGVGVVAGLFAIAMLAWEVVRLLAPRLDLGGIEAGLVSLVLAAGMLLFTVITFLTHNEARHWPAWIGLALSIVVGGAAAARARAEGVHLPAGRPPQATPPAV